MPSIIVKQAPLLSPNNAPQTPLRLHIAQLRAQKNQIAYLVADSLDSADGQLNQIRSVLTSPPAPLTSFYVTDTDGSLLAWIGDRVVNSVPYVGAWFKQLYVGGTSPVNAPLFTDQSGNVMVGQHGSISVLDPGGNQVGWIGEQQETAKTITSTTNASPDVVTIASHGYNNGDTVLVAGATGDTAINGYRIVESVTTNTFQLTDLSGTPINGNGAYGGGGTAIRYEAGAWFQTAAFGGTGFNNAKLRVYADGTVVITLSSIVVVGNGATTTINNTMFTTAGVAGLTVQDTGPGTRTIIVSDNGFYIRATDGATYVVNMNAAGDNGELRLGNIANTAFVSLQSNTGITVNDSAGNTSTLAGILLNLPAGGALEFGGFATLTATQLTLGSGGSVVINTQQVVGARLSAVSTVGGIAGSTYTATEQAILNNCVTAINSIINRLVTHGLIS